MRFSGGMVPQPSRVTGLIVTGVGDHSLATGARFSTKDDPTVRAHLSSRLFIEVSRFVRKTTDALPEMSLHTTLLSSRTVKVVNSSE